MSAENYHFSVGSFECTVISDGSRAYHHPAQLFFANAPEEALAQALRAYGIDPAQWDEYVSPYPALFIKAGQLRVLVDTGAGSLEPSTGRLVPNLQAEGIACEDIDLVILTHGHPDHIGGNLDAQGNPAFPNARYVMSGTDWQFWTSEPDLSSLQIPDVIKEIILEFARRDLPPIEGQLDLVDGNSEIAPGIRAVEAPGHTPGHIGISVSSEGEQLLYIVDAALHPIHLAHPDWVSALDLDPDQAVATRRQLLEKAAATKAMVFATHFPSPGLGHVIQSGDAWQWQPVEPTE